MIRLQSCELQFFHFDTIEKVPINHRIVQLPKIIKSDLHPTMLPSESQIFFSIGRTNSIYYLFNLFSIRTQ